MKSPSFGAGLPFSASFMAVLPPLAVTIVVGSILNVDSTPFTVTVIVSWPMAFTGPRTHLFCARAGTDSSAAARTTTVSMHTRLMKSSL